MYQIGRLAQLVEHVLSMHYIVGSIMALSSKNVIFLIVRLGELQTEDNIMSHLKAPCLIHGQYTFTNFNSSTKEIPFFKIITNPHPTINLSIKLPLDWFHNLKPNSKTDLNINTIQTSIYYSTHSGILQTHLQQLAMQKLPILFLEQSALKYHRTNIYFKWIGSWFLPYQTCNKKSTPIHGYHTKDYMGF